MRTFKYFLGASFIAFLCLVLLLSVNQKVSAGNSNTPEFWCVENGGSWTGVDGDEYSGTCLYNPGQHESPCDSDQYALETFVEGESIGWDCFDASTPMPGGPGDSDQYGHNSGQSTDVVIHLCTLAAGDWRCAYFTEGTCTVNCYIDPHLPAGAQAALPGGVITTLYVNISPDPGGSYSVCFENPDNESLTIYQYLGGVWVAIAISTNNPICASSSGDGSFYLGS